MGILMRALVTTNEVLHMQGPDLARQVAPLHPEIVALHAEVLVPI
jgi:hypothetical protein